MNVIENASGGVVSICVPNLTDITWEEIPGFSKYQVSNLGVVRHKRTGKTPNITQVKTSQGTYLRVSAISDDNRHRSKELHYLVCLAFHGQPPTPDHEVNHKDGNKHHNLPDNVEWMTRGENLEHAYDTGLRKDNTPIIVTDHESGDTERFSTIASLARFLGVSKSTVDTVITTHRFVKYRGRYTFEKDFTDRKVNGWDWVRDVVAYDYVDNTLILASDLAQLEWVINVNRNTIGRRLRGQADKDELVAGYVFRYQDELEAGAQFPRHSKSKAIESREAYFVKKKPRPKRYGVRVKNYVDNSIVECATFKEVSELTGISIGTVRYLLDEKSNRPFKGYGFQYLDDVAEFPAYDKETIQISLVKKKPEYPSVRVKDLETNTTKLYPSMKELASEVGVTSAAIARHHRNKPKIPYKDRYSLELVY